MKLKFFKKNFKYIFIAFVLIAVALYQITTLEITGKDITCDLNDEPNVTAVLSKAYENHAAVSLHGKNENFAYQWFYDSGNLTGAADTNLTVYPINKNIKTVKKLLKAQYVTAFQFHDNINLNGTPQLTLLKLNEIQQDTPVLIYQLIGHELKFIKEAVVNNQDIAFDVNQTKGIFYIASGFGKQDINVLKKEVFSLKKAKETVHNREEDADKIKTSAAASDEQKKKTTKSKTDDEIKPVDLDEQVVEEEKVLTCTLSVDCRTILSNMADLKHGKEVYVPKNGFIYGPRTVVFHEGENVYDVLARELRASGIALDSNGYTQYSSAYIKGINHLYQFDCGKSSGWLYFVNGVQPSFGCSRYVLSNGDIIQWRYSCKSGDLK